MALVAGIDTSTQSCKVTIRDADSGELLRRGWARHPQGTEVDPERWWDALQEALRQAGGLDDVAAVSIAGQQHGMVCLDERGEVIRPALLWNDIRSAPDAERLVAAAGPTPELGREHWAQATGTVPVASLTVSKLHWLAANEPANARKVAAVCLPHDWLQWRLAGYGPGKADFGSLVTDRSDASGTGYFSAVRDAYLPEVVRDILGHDVVLPRVLGPLEAAGRLPSGQLLGPGAGDNAAAALGVGAQLGDVVVSLGTSGTIFAVSPEPGHDPSGVVAGFADAAGHFLPLVCTLNAARVFDATATVLGVSLEGLDALASAARPGAGGLTMVPYFEGERTPNLPHAKGGLHGMTLDNFTPGNVARAGFEGVIASLALGLDALEAQGAKARRVILVGGGSQAATARAVAADIFGLPVLVPAPDEYVARGAALQAAGVLKGEFPSWRQEGHLVPQTLGDGVALSAFRHWSAGYLG
ncbi:xylulokinase [Arthrobacter sp. NPDC090010]|uniref:xylulokinase n=1 Tax=Arthrobacter sp. NPDC090010 TaxID=3363942 RepID=UPI003820AE31